MFNYQGDYPELREGVVPAFQSIYEQSETIKAPLGCKRDFGDRKFVYCKAGGALTAGTVGKMPAMVPNHINIVVVAAAVGFGNVGDNFMKVTLGATAATKNQYADGYIHFNDNTQEGRTYRILRHAAAIGGAVLTLELYDQLLEALVAGDQVYLEANPFAGVVIHSHNQTELPVGIPLLDITNGYYYWAQYWGPCSVLCDADPAGPGEGVTLSALTDGAVGQRDAITDPLVGVARVLGVSTEFTPVFLTIPL